MKILIACEMSGRVRDAFTARGHDAVSCDLVPSLTPGPHIIGDVLPLLAEPWDMVIAFPPCTDLSVIGVSTWKIKQADGRQGAAVAFVDALWNANATRVAIENPVGFLNRNWRKPDQIINPWMFGDPWRKRTCLWLRGLPLLVPTDIVEPVGHWVDGGSRVERNRGTKGRLFADEKFGSSSHAARQAARSATFPGIAAALAEQWDAPPSMDSSTPTHEARAVQRIYAAQLDAMDARLSDSVGRYVRAEARLAAVARLARNLHANGNRVLAEDLLRTIEEQT